jgi:hypothetical protein
MNIKNTDDNEAYRRAQQALKYCPFCGYEVGFVEVVEVSAEAAKWFSAGWTVECVDPECFASNALHTWPTWQAAASAWNKRR